MVAPAAQAQPAQLATGACAEGGLFGAVEPLAVAVLGGLVDAATRIGAMEWKEAQASVRFGDREVDHWSGWPRMARRAGSA